VQYKTRFLKGKFGSRRAFTTAIPKKAMKRLKNWRWKSEKNKTIKTEIKSKRQTNYGKSEIRAFMTNNKK